MLQHLLSMQHIVFLVFRENLQAKDFSTGVDLLSLAVIQILMNQLLASFSLKLISG